MRGLDGKGVLIVGGTSGIGLATARRFLEEGSRVFVAGIEEAELKETRQTLAELGAMATSAARVRVFSDDGQGRLVAANDNWAQPVSGGASAGSVSESREGDMTSQGQPTISALQALAGDGTLTGSWILDPARSEVRLQTRHTWGLRPLHGVFRQVAGNGTVTAAGQVTGTLTVDGRTIASSLRGMVVPGSQQVKAEAEAEGAVGVLVAFASMPS